MYNINEILTEFKQQDKEFYNLIPLILSKRMQVGKVSNCQKLVDIIGVEKFIEVMDMLGGKIITLPSPKDFEKTVTGITIYYLRIYKHLTWEQIQKLFPNVMNVKIEYGHISHTLTALVKKELKTPKPLDKDNSIFYND